MITKIKNKIDEYLEFDSSILFKDKYCVIYGGAVRDCIADQQINDIDILCLEFNLNNIVNLLTNYGYIKQKNTDTITQYANIESIFNVNEYRKNNKIVQIIIPAILLPTVNGSDIFKTIDKSELYYKSFFEFLKSIDISCCGLVYNGNIYESIPNSIVDCLTKNFIYYDDNSLSGNKDKRINKLKNRGWNFLNVSKKQQQRILKINNIISEYNNISILIDKYQLNNKKCEDTISEIRKLYQIATDKNIQEYCNNIKCVCACYSPHYWFLNENS